MANGGRGRQGVKSDETLCSIFEHLRDANGAGMTELAGRLDLAKSSVHDHLSTMREHGFVVKRGDASHLGLAFFSYGQYVRNSDDVYEAATPVVDDLVETPGEMTWLMTHQDCRVMYLYARAGRTDVDEDLEGIHAIGVPLRFETDVRGALAIAGDGFHRLPRAGVAHAAEERLEDAIVLSA